MREAISQERTPKPPYSTDVTGRVIKRFVQLGTRCILLAVIGLGLSIPLFDQNAIERTLWHEHLVFGGTAAERTRALEAHLSGTAWPNGPATARRFAPSARTGSDHWGKSREGVSIVGTPAGLSAASIGIGGPGLAAPDSPTSLASPSRGDPAFSFDGLRLTEVLLSIPEPPPRSAT